MGQPEFEKALEDIKTLPDQPPNVLLELYGLYKQATVGDVTGKRPGLLDLKGKAKYDAWATRKGMTKEASMDEYATVAQRLLKEQAK